MALLVSSKTMKTGHQTTLVNLVANVELLEEKI